MAQKLLVTGASGKLGQLVLDALLRRGVAASDIIAATRDVSKLAGHAARGVEIRKADFNDPDSLSSAFAGADRVAIISTDALDGAGTRIKQHANAVSAAKAAGVKHILYTSMPQPNDTKVIFSADHLKTEEAVKASGLGYTILRNSWYQENMFMNLPAVFASGQWYTSAGEGRIAHVAREDVAEALAAALASGSNESATYTLTGPEARSTAEIAALASEVVGRPIAVIQVDDEQLAAGMKAAGMPDFVIPTIISFEAATRDGNLSALTDDVEMLTGRKPKPFRAFFEENRAAFAG